MAQMGFGSAFRQRSRQLPAMSGTANAVTRPLAQPPVTTSPPLAVDGQMTTQVMPQTFGNEPAPMPAVPGQPGEMHTMGAPAGNLAGNGEWGQNRGGEHRMRGRARPFGQTRGNFQGFIEQLRAQPLPAGLPAYPVEGAPREAWRQWAQQVGALYPSEVPLYQNEQVRALFPNLQWPGTAPAQEIAAGEPNPAAVSGFAEDGTGLLGAPRFRRR